MGMGPIALACLLLTVQGAGGPDAWYLNQRGFWIPIRGIKPEKRAELSALHLYVSRDQGLSWELQEKGAPDKEKFAFQANKDGTYWFTVATVNARGDESPNPSQVPPMQKIIVDTVRPSVRILAADRHGAEVHLTWHVQEDHPDPSAMRVDYRTADMPEGQWTPVPFVPGAAEQAAFRPVGTGEVQVRVQAVDLAGNKGEAAQTVPGGTPAGAAATQASAVESVGPLPGAAPAGSAPTRVVSGPPPADRLSLDSGLIPGAPAPAPDSPPPSPPPAGRPAPPAPLAPAFPAGAPPAMGPAAPAGPAAPLSGVTRGSLPPLQVVNKRQVKLGFDVGHIGPSGLGAVEVYVTTDEGTTWEQTPVGPDTVLPPGVDGRSAGPVRGSVTVSLAREGVAYGFYIVVKNRAGGGKLPPQRGEPPQVRLELDATRPLAKLYAPAEDTARPNALVLAWTAWDRNLAQNAVVLEWSEQKEGPWAPINPEPLSNNLPEQAGAGPDRQNTPTGSYSWQVPDRMPAKVYLRLSVRDTAGNVAVAETREPVIIDLSKPEVGSVAPVMLETGSH